MSLLNRSSLRRLEPICHLTRSRQGIPGFLLPTDIPRTPRPHFLLGCHRVHRSLYHHHTVFDDFPVYSGTVVLGPRHQGQVFGCWSDRLCEQRIGYRTGSNHLGNAHAEPLPPAVKFLAQDSGGSNVRRGYIVSCNLSSQRLATNNKSADASQP